MGHKVLLVDNDPQGSLTISLGYPRPDELEVTLFDLLNKTINEDSVTAGEGILHQAEGIDLIPANISLAGLEVALVNTMNRERILKQFLEPVKGNYDYVLLDCMPSLGMLTVNALAAADAALRLSRSSLSGAWALTSEASETIGRGPLPAESRRSDSQRMSQRDAKRPPGFLAPFATARLFWPSSPIIVRMRSCSLSFTVSSTIAFVWSVRRTATRPPRVRARGSRSHRGAIRAGRGP